MRPAIHGASRLTPGGGVGPPIIGAHGRPAGLARRLGFSSVTSQVLERDPTHPVRVRVDKEPTVVVGAVETRRAAIEREAALMTCGAVVRRDER